MKTEVTMNEIRQDLHVTSASTAENKTAVAHPEVFTECYIVSIVYLYTSKACETKMCVVNNMAG